ncbi:MAG: TRAP transporter large permease subunit, partial [Gammaproteobacteria bacterium]
VLLISLFLLYILLLSWWRPAVAPTIGTNGREEALAGRVLRSLVPPLLLVGAVLGSIFFGVASPTESAAVGGLGALALAASHRRLNLKMLNESMRQTTRLTSMVFLILIGATTFGLVFRGLGGDRLVHELLTGLPGGQWTFLAISMAAIFALGFFLDFLEICFIVVPILAPIASHLGIDLLWFALLIAVNLQTSFLTPPFGFSLFYLKAVAPPEVRLAQIYRGIIPFVAIQVATIVLLLLFPRLALWFPDLMDRMQGLAN